MFPAGHSRLGAEVGAGVVGALVGAGVKGAGVGTSVASTGVGAGVAGQPGVSNIQEQESWPSSRQVSNFFFLVLKQDASLSSTPSPSPITSALTAPFRPPLHLFPSCCNELTTMRVQDKKRTISDALKSNPFA